MVKAPVPFKTIKEPVPAETVKTPVPPKGAPRRDPVADAVADAATFGLIAAPKPTLPTKAPPFKSQPTAKPKGRPRK